MDLEHEPDVGVDGPLVVTPVRAVGRAHLDQAGARLGHHVGDAEPATDLDQLASRDDHAAFSGQGRQHEEDCCRPVVHHERSVGSCRPGKQGGGVAAARATAARAEIELEVRVGRVLGVGQRGPAEVGVQEHAGGVHGRAEQIEPDALGARPGRGGISRGDGGPGGVDQ